MKVKVLVITDTPGFGDLIHQTLVESGQYQVELFTDAGEALGRAQEQEFALAILDSDLEEIPISDLIQALRKVKPGIRLIVIPPNNDAQHPMMVGLDVQGFLNKPFYLPELQETLEKVLPPVQPVLPPQPRVTGSRTASHSAGSANQPPAWLQDVTRAAQHLTGLSLESSAQAALIVKDSSLWAYAGQLSQPAAQELAGSVSNFWAQEREMPPGAHRESAKSDLARFIRLVETGSEYMIYATSLGTGMVLALAFDAETPFSKIRSQASHLARALTSPPAPDEPGLPARIAQPDPETKKAVRRPISVLVNPPAGQVRHPPMQIPDLSENWLKLDNLARDLFTAEVDNGEEETDLEEAQIEESQRIKPELPERQKAPSQARIVLEPVTPGMVNLVYACAIVPRLPQHHLAGDLADRLEEWAGQLCLAFAWRLEYISVAPEYMQWLVSVSPTISPSYLMRILRQHTSKRIFAEFPELARANPSGDFWAPGYLIMSGSQLPPEKVVLDFLREIRQHQGASYLYPPRYQR